MKNALITLGLAICSFSIGYTEQLKCYFTYTIKGIDNNIGGGFSTAPQSAFLIFNTAEQKVKIVNFLHVSPLGILTSSNLFAKSRTLEVKRRVGDTPVTTLSQLFDFTVTEWHGREEVESGLDLRYFREFTVTEEGNWDKTQLDDESLTPWTVDGEIVGFSAFSPMEHDNLFFDRGRIPGNLFLSTNDQLGFRYTLYSSDDLSAWNRVEPIFTESFNGKSLVDLTDTLIGFGYSLDLYFIEMSKIEKDRFFKLEISPLRFEHL